ncbi:MAG: CotH kinase family protein [Bacteroidetes bacterium]|nr:CotH kinase family protein [Bacteroidota bacterium]
MKKIYVSVCVIFIGVNVLFAQTFIGGGGPINDVSTNDFPVIVSGLVPSTIDTANFGLESVCINLTHTWDADMEIRIIAPDGTSAILSSGNGGSGHDYTNTCFDNSAATNISQGGAPFTGSFIPQGQMGVVNNNQNGNGTWVLRVIDMYAQDFGTMLNWSITFGNNPASYFSMQDSNLPIVMINANNQNIPDSPKISCDMGIIFNGVGNRNHITDPWNNYNGKIGIEVRGSSSQGFPKKSYGLQLWDSTSLPINHPILGMPSENDWCLIANYSDKSLLNNSLSYYLSRQMGWYAVRWRCVELIIDGQYMGVYLLTEKLKRDNARVNISKLNPTDTTGDQLTGGYIIKVDKTTSSSGAGWVSPFAPDTAPNGQTIYFQYDYPSDVNINVPQQNYIQAYVDSFETTLAGPNFADTSIGYAHYMNVNSFIDYFLVNELSKNVDGYRLSTFFYKDRASHGGKITMGPVWDYDISWANANYCDGSVVSGWAYQFGNVCSGDYWQIPFWWDRLMQDPVFRDKVQCRWQELSQTLLSKQFLFNYCDSMAILLNESQQRNFTVWPILGTYVWPNPSPIPTTYQGEIDELKNWIDLRWDWLNANMPGNAANCNLNGIPSATSYATTQPLAFPNPFANEINLSIFLPHEQPVKMELLNALGQVVQPIQLQQHAGGTQTIVFHPDASLPTGIYLLRITAGNNTWTEPLSKTE